MARIIVSIVLTAAIIFGGITLSKKFGQQPDPIDKNRKAVAKGVFVEVVENKSNPVVIVSNGQLIPSRKVTLTSEVTGVLRSSTFKEGYTYNRGQTVCVIDDSESNANVASQRSNFYARLLTIMPDLKLDYPESWAVWDSYLKSIDIQQNLPPLPAFTDERTKNFVTANGIVANYQSVKNIEIRTGKYRLSAPFNGVITQANVQEGSLVTMNQPLGEISSLGDYELALPVNVTYMDYLKVGRSIELTTIDGKDEYRGKIERINPSVDVNSQSITAYIRVINKALREGMFLQAEIDAGEIEKSLEIDRKLLNADNQIFVMLEDSTLDLTSVKPIYFKDETAIVKGLEDGMTIIKKALSGAYVGMKVKVLEETSNL